MTLKENLIISKRGFLYLFKLEKTYAIILILTSFLKAITPYISIFMSAKIINELILGKRREVLIVYICITVGLTFIAMMAKSILEKMETYHLDFLYMNEQKAFADKIMRMDYNLVEDVNTTHLRERIRIESQTGYNLYYLYTSVANIMYCIFSIISASSLTISLFSNSRISLLLKLSLVIAISILTIINYLTVYKNQVIESKYFKDAVGFNTMGNYLNGHLDNYQSGKEIRIYNMGKIVSNIYQKYINRVDEFMFDTHKQMMYWGIINKLFSYILQFIAYSVVILGVIEGGIEIGLIVQYVSCIILLVSGFEKLIENVQKLFQNNQYLKNYFSFFDMPSKFDSGELKAEKEEYEIQFNNVSFKYPGTDEFALKNVSVKVRQGEKIAIVGENGSGKTTFVKLLCRLYEPTEGEILLNGINIKKYDYLSYLSILSVVFQDFFTLSFTIGQNIACETNYDKEKVINFLDSLDMLPAIENLPSGIDTYLYKDFDNYGVEISGGEAQKLAIARALYKDTPFIILDEPTAALDPISEYEIFEKINKISKSKTTIYISHRLSSCCFCDTIFVFHKGKLIQEGAHNTLLSERKGKYYELWNTQAQFYQE